MLREKSVVFTNSLFMHHTFSTNKSTSVSGSQSGFLFRQKYTFCFLAQVACRSRRDQRLNRIKCYRFISLVEPVFLTSIPDLDIYTYVHVGEDIFLTENLLDKIAQQSVAFSQKRSFHCKHFEKLICFIYSVVCRTRALYRFSTKNFSSIQNAIAENPSLQSFLKFVTHLLGW